SIDRLAQRPLGSVDVDLRDALPDVTRARVQQQPDLPVVLVDADLDEVIAAAESSELVKGFVHERARSDVGLAAVFRPGERFGERFLLLLEPDGNLPLDRVAEL